MSASACQANPLVPDRSSEAELTQFLGFLRRAIDEAGWKHEALAAYLQDHGARGMDAPYLAKVLAGTKPLPVRVLVLLPNDVEARLSQYYAEAHGALVVERVTGDRAVQCLASGLFGVLAGQRLMAKATLPVRVRRMA